VVLRFGFDLRLPPAAEIPLQAALVALAAVMLLSARHAPRFFGLTVLAFAVTGSWQAGLSATETVRSFFGVHQVVETADRSHRLLFHGTTIHGAERIRDAAGGKLAGVPEPLTYYYFGGPISETLAAARQARGALSRVAVVGLGTGSMACHRRDEERWSFYEIDPEVIRIARDPALFRFLGACAPDAPVVAGDARLTLAASPVRYDLIVIDAFSSDAIPVHLLTREALAGYLSRLTPGGMIAMHVSNRHMELASVVAAVGAAEGLTTAWKQDRTANDFARDFRANAEVVALARHVSDFGDLLKRPGWRPLVPRPDVPAWTDDYSDVLRAILRKKF
jgi:predicted O-methyltransferase YrrM